MKKIVNVAELMRYLDNRLQEIEGTALEIRRILENYPSREFSTEEWQTIERKWQAISGEARECLSARSWL